MKFWFSENAFNLFIWRKMASKFFVKLRVIFHGFKSGDRICSLISYLLCTQEIEMVVPIKNAFKKPIVLKL